MNCINYILLRIVTSSILEIFLFIVIRVKLMLSDDQFSFLHSQTTPTH